MVHLLHAKRWQNNSCVTFNDVWKSADILRERRLRIDSVGEIRLLFWVSDRCVLGHSEAKDFTWNIIDRQTCKGLTHACLKTNMQPHAKPSVSSIESVWLELTNWWPIKPIHCIYHACMACIRYLLFFAAAAAAKAVRMMCIKLEGKWLVITKEFYCRQF